MRKNIFLTAVLFLFLYSCTKESKRVEYEIITKVYENSIDETMVLKTSLLTIKDDGSHNLDPKKVVVYNSVKDVNRYDIAINIKQERKNAMKSLSKWMSLNNVKDTFNVYNEYMKNLKK